MASCSKKTELRRQRKDHPNKSNLKKDEARISKNFEILSKALAAKQ